MGDRGNLGIKYENNEKIYFYGHYCGFDMFNILKNALIKGKERWNDEAYLARIIFCELIKDDVDGTTGYGISPYICDNEYPIFEINPNERIVSLPSQSWTFNEFIELECDPRIND
jgi:hypothetical protein